MRIVTLLLRIHTMCWIKKCITDTGWYTMFCRASEGTLWSQKFKRPLICESLMESLTTNIPGIHAMCQLNWQHNSHLAGLLWPTRSKVSHSNCSNIPSWISNCSHKQKQVDNDCDIQSLRRVLKTSLLFHTQEHSDMDIAIFSIHLNVICNSSN